jgi:hypothetical protein
MRRMRIIDHRPSKRFERAWGSKAIEIEREFAPERWLLLGMRERSCYYPLRCFARATAVQKLKASPSSPPSWPSTATGRLN